MKIASKTVYLDKDGKATEDPNLSESLLVAEGSPLRDDLIAKIEESGLTVHAHEESTHTTAEPSDSGEKAVTDAPEDKALDSAPENKAVTAAPENKGRNRRKPAETA